MAAGLLDGQPPVLEFVQSQRGMITFVSDLLYSAFAETPSSGARARTIAPCILSVVPRDDS